MPKCPIKDGKSVLQSIPWEYLSLFPALALSLIAWGVALFSIYISNRGGNMLDINPSIFLIGSLIAGGIGSILLILSVAFMIAKFFTKAPIIERLDKIQKGLDETQSNMKGLARKEDIDNLSSAINRLNETLQGVIRIKRKDRRKRRQENVRKPRG